MTHSNKSTSLTGNVPSGNLEGFELTLTRVAVSALLDLAAQRGISLDELPDIESLSMSALKLLAKRLHEIVYAPPLK